tara:strand:+ start:118 stop:342 length:225 start_codon:yes stop_codon:yes gene_type:complete
MPKKEKIDWNKYKQKYEYVCSECGSGNVMEPSWVYANSDTIGGRVDSVPFDLCDDCDKEMIIITRDEWNEKREA